MAAVQCASDGLACVTLHPALKLWTWEGIITKQGEEVFTTLRTLCSNLASIRLEEKAVRSSQTEEKIKTWSGILFSFFFFSFCLSFQLKLVFYRLCETDSRTDEQLVGTDLADG